MMSHKLPRLALISSFAVAFTTVGVAQTPPQQDETAPRSASSPHQRDTTSTQAQEAPSGAQTDPNAASTPHQQQSTQGMTKSGADRDRTMMNDCMRQEAQRNSSWSAAQVKKACMDKMKTQSTKKDY